MQNVQRVHIGHSAVHRSEQVPIRERDRAYNVTAIGRHPRHQCVNRHRAIIGQPVADAVDVGVTNEIKRRRSLEYYDGTDAGGESVAIGRQPMVRYDQIAILCYGSQG
jgi:hypothetical protein